MVEEVGGIRYHHFHRNHMWVGKCPVGSGRLYMGTKAAKRAVSHGKKTAFADASLENEWNRIRRKNVTFPTSQIRIPYVRCYGFMLQICHK